MAYLYDPSRDPIRVYYGTDTRAYTFLFGAVAALVAPYLRARGRRVDRVLAPCALVAVLAVMTTNDPGVLYRGGFALVAIAAALVTVATTVPGPLRRALDRAPFARLGGCRTASTCGTGPPSCSSRPSASGDRPRAGGRCASRSPPPAPRSRGSSSSNRSRSPDRAASRSPAARRRHRDRDAHRAAGRARVRVLEHAHRPRAATGGAFSRLRHVATACARRRSTTPTVGARSHASRARHRDDRR